MWGMSGRWGIDVGVISVRCVMEHLNRLLKKDSNSSGCSTVNREIIGR